MDFLLLQHTEQAVRFVFGAGGEIQVGWNARGSGGAKSQAPETVDRQLAEARIIADRLEREIKTNHPMPLDLRLDPWTAEVQSINRILRPLEETVSTSESRGINN